MSFASPVQHTLAAQFAAVGPRAIKGRARHPMAVTLDDGVSVRWQYRAARRRPGAVTFDMTVVVVTYDGGADLYDVAVSEFDGTTCESTEPRTIEGVDVEGLALVGVGA